MVPNRFFGRSLFLNAALLAPFLWFASRAVPAQEAITLSATTGDVQVQELSPEQLEAMKSGQPVAVPGQPGVPPGAQPAGPPGQPGQPGQPPGQPGKPGDNKGKPGEGGDKKAGEGPATVKRPEKPPRVPDPREFDVKLDDKGQVPPFNFIGQPWPDVMQWLANVSKCSLDWQELPNDYLNLTTQRTYSLDEVRDLINRHLSARGFISVQSGELLSVFKIEKLDPSVVRRVKEDELYDLKPYDFVKVAFELPEGMEVDKAKEDVKQVLNPTAKIFPLVSSRQLLVMDSVANLRTVSELLNQERLIKDGRIVPKEIVLKHARPQQVIEILYVILGMDPKGKPAQTDPQAQAQMMQQMQQMQQQGGGRDMAKLMKQQGEQPKVYLAFNRQRNSVLVNAPPEQMKVIERTITYLDVPFGADSGAANAAEVENTQRVMKPYTLTTLDPSDFRRTLEEIGGLSPYAEFKTDDDTRTIFAMAPESDHVKIKNLITQFDGSGREFEVIQLRRLPADAVAASINNLMGTQGEKEDKSRNYGYSPWDYDPWRERQEGRKKQTKAFGCDADIERNRLLLWANENEMKRVHDLLVKLGEISGGQADARPVRVIAPTDAKDTAALLEKLRTAWSSSGGNELIIKAPPAPKPAPAVKAEGTEKPAATSAEEPTPDRATKLPSPTRVPARFAQLDAALPAAAPTSPSNDPSAPASANSAGAAEKETHPPVTITVTEDGRLMLSSPDTAALDRMEDMIEELAPQEKRFKIFPCKYIRASEMWYDLTDFFEDELKSKSGEMIRDWNGFLIPTGNDKDKSGTGLSKRRKLMITYDRPSNSILVANASNTQLAEIQQLIEQFDKPAKSDSVEIRQTAAIKIHYSKPSVIAAAVKEVYRDLLSSRDKEFDRGDKREERSSTERTTILSFGPQSSSGSDSDRKSAIKVGFDGALSLGADDISGVLIVSAQKGIFDDIVRMVRELDNEAAPQTTVHVHHMTGNVSAESVQKALEKAVGRAWLGNRPEQQPNQTGQDDKKRGENNQNRGDRRRGNDGNNNNGGGDGNNQ
jgi:type II secretory pathway component GspD/PulD (secretin)